MFSGWSGRVLNAATMALGKALGKDDMALQTLQDGAIRLPGNPDILTDLGGAQLRINKLPDAIKTLTDAFTAPTGFDLVLAGNVSIADDGSDLTVDRLSGSFTGDVAVTSARHVTATLPVTGARVP